MACKCGHSYKKNVCVCVCRALQRRQHSDPWEIKSHGHSRSVQLLVLSGASVSILCKCSYLHMFIYLIIETSDAEEFLEIHNSNW